MRLPDFSVKKPVTITMLILIVVVLGSISLSKMGLDLMPDITFPLVSVVTEYQGVSSEDIENLVTKPVEETVSTVKNVKNLSSVSREGISGVMVEFEWGTDIDYAAQDIRDRIDMMRSFLPDDIKEPQVVKFDPGMIPVGGWGVTGNYSMRELKRIVEDEIEDEIQQVDGVSAVFLWGGREREIRVELDTKKLKAYKVPVEMVSSRIAQGNINLPGGRLTQGYKEITLRAVGEFGSIEDVKNTLVTKRGGTPVYVKDLGKVLDTNKEVRATARTNGKEGILMMAYKESKANTVQVSGRVEKKIKKLEKKYSGDLRIHSFLDQGHIIKRILNVTLSTALWGGLLAVGVLFFFLRSFRSTLIIAVAIPLSIFTTFLPLFAAGFTLNFVVLIGVALGVGMIVDNSIVVIENSYRQLGILKDPAQASAKGANQVGMAITASTLTTVAVFVPLFFAGGIVGKIFSEMAITVASALLSSLLVALTIIPMLSSKILKSGNNKRNEWIEPLRNWYEEILRKVLNRKKKLGYGIIAAVVISIGAFPLMKVEFFPRIDSSMVMMNIKREVGTVIEETNRIVKRVEEVFEKQKGVLVFSSFIGITEGGEIDAAMGTGPSGPHEASIYCRLKDKKDRKMSNEDIENSVRKQLPAFEDSTYEFMDLGKAMLVAGGRQEYPIQVEIYGPDLEVLRDLSAKIKGKIESIPQIFDAGTSIEQGRPELVSAIDRKKAAKFGLTSNQVGNALKSSVKGTKAGIFRTEGKEIDITVILDEKDRNNLHSIKSLPVMTEGGGIISLSQVADLKTEKGPVKLEREDKRRKVIVRANYSGDSFSEIMDAVRDKTQDIIIPGGYYMEYGGEAEDVREMFITLAQLILLAVLLIYMVMAAQFESFVHPLIIMFTLPLAYIGVVWFIIATGKTLSMPSGMGVLILFGIIVNNAIVLIDYINHLRRDKGLSITEAVVNGAKVRLRPILMTASTTIFAMVPMALNKAEGSAIRSVVAISIIGGLVVGTVLTLFVIPMVYDYIEKKIARKKTS